MSVVVARLVVTAGGSGGLLLRAGTFKVGRAGDCDLVLTDPKVSRVHASVVVTADAARVVDHGSRNGTFVAGERVAAGDIGHGACVRFGDTLCVYERVGVGDEDTTFSGSAAAGAAADLSPAEERVFERLLGGLSEKAIAARLALSPHTVHNHVRRIYAAFHVHTRAELIATALRVRAAR
jgi:DNA-binding CsgD family transcriptional regulator